MAAGRCAWCRKLLDATKRRDSKTCSKRCRQAAHRFGRACVVRERAARPLRFGYADPPYPGLARRYYKDHPDYAGEVDHRALLSRLQQFDGWALSTSERALPMVLGLCSDLGLEVRVGAWLRGARPSRSRGARSSWEPVVYCAGRRVASKHAGVDSLAHAARARSTDPGYVIGAKPARFCFWLFELLGALPGDTFVDMFPGSGGVARAWEIYVSREYSGDVSRGAGGDTSRIGVSGRELMAAIDTARAGLAAEGVAITSEWLEEGDGDVSHVDAADASRVRH